MNDVLKKEERIMIVIKILFSLLLCVPLTLVAYQFLKKLVDELYKNRR